MWSKIIFVSDDSSRGETADFSKYLYYFSTVDYIYSILFIS